MSELLSPTQQFSAIKKYIANISMCKIMDLFYEQDSGESKIYDGLNVIFNQEQFRGMREKLSKKQTEIDFGDKEFIDTLGLLFAEIEKLEKPIYDEEEKNIKKKKKYRYR
ncbi:MAG: hypothetical protein FWD58_06240 [Firmicutes bacterium]|nr:hypothetical protein [Bacillota bacterium]